MKRTIFTGLVACTALRACGGSASDNPAGDGEDIAATADTSDGLITCDMPNFDNMQGLTLTQRFILMDGEVKRYLQFTNEAFDLCEPGQENCSLGLDGRTIRMDHLNEEGVRSRYDVDLASMEIVARKTQPGEAEEVMTFDEGAKCVREPLPGGLTVK